MRYIFAFPDIGEGISEGKIVEWHIEKGNTLSPGDPVVQMETDKVVTDIPSPKGGRVVSRFGNIGDTINVGDALIELDVGDDAAENDRKAVEESGAGVVGTLEEAGSSAYLPASDEGTGITKKEEKQKKKVLATPVARAMAKQLGIDIEKITGTGPAGRVTKEDIQHYSPSAAAYGNPNNSTEGGAEEVETVEMSPLRKTIAQHMMTSRRETAFMSVFEEINGEALGDVVSRYRDRFAEKGIKLTCLPFIVKAAVFGLKNHPGLNSELDSVKEVIVRKKYYHIGIAVDTEEGLVVPVVKNADKKSITEIAGEIGTLAEKARNKKLSIDEMKEGTFSVTNYGPIGGIHATPVINYPQCAILGVGRAVERPVVRNGAVVPGLIIPLSLTADHRIVDGGEAARFLREVMSYLSDPMRMLLE